MTPPPDLAGPGQDGADRPDRRRGAESAGGPGSRTWLAGRPGSHKPLRRLAITPATAVTAARSNLPRPSPAALVSRATQRRPFPLSAPSWPDSLPRPIERSKLGSNYDSEWARSYAARFGRVLLTELVTRPAVAAIANPHVEGADRLAHLHEPVIFAANHSSHVDTPLLLSVLPDRWRHRTVVAGAADYFFDSRAKATFFALTINAIPMERTRVSRNNVNQAAGLLRDGWSLLIFPEGGRSPDGWARPHTAGAAWLAARTGRPIVPVHVSGTRAILARGSNRLKPGSTDVTFGRPIRPSEGTDARQLGAQVEAAIAALADERQTDWWAARRRAASGTSPGLTGPEAGAWRRAWALDRPDRGEGSNRAGRWPRP